MRRWLAMMVGVAVAAAASAPGAGLAYAKGPDPSPVVNDGAYVRSSDSDDFAPAADGAAVASGNAIRSGATRGARIDIADGVSIRLAPGTSIIMRTSQWLPAEHPGASAVRAQQLSLLTGEIDIEVHEPKGAIGVTVLLPGGRSLALWRGSANVSLDGDRAAIALYDGMAIAGAGTRWQPLTAGKGVILTAKGEPATRPIPGKTEWSKGTDAPSSFVLVRGAEGGVVGAAWSAAPGAVKYRVELGHDAAMTGDVTVASSNDPVFKSDPLVAGTYALRVRAVSADGILGPLSPATMLRVARVTLPKGGFAAADGNVVVPAGGALTLDDPRDLEMATVVRHDMPDDALFWTPASTQISLGSAARREIRVRHAPSHTEMAFVLIRRALKAHVSFSPNHPRWPHDPVVITVRLEDPSGYLDPAREVIDINARLDIDRMPLDWKHAGDTWTATVAPHTQTAGPWIIRVDVNDNAGSPIGASLVDIDGPSAEPTFRQATFQQ